MHHHPIFSQFHPAKVVGTGRHVFDFLGVATDCAYKKGWERHALRAGLEYTADYPAVNEHYFDWIALLRTVRAASGTYRMAELGAGWAPWLVRATFAARQMPAISGLELLGVEADATHCGWVNEHFRDNGLQPADFYLIHGAVSATPTVLRFPKIANPAEDYGASLKAVNASTEYVEVQGYVLEDLLGRFSAPVDFLHMDIQGAEYDVVPGAMGLLGQRVKAMMVGTHTSQDRHLQLADTFRSHGWTNAMLYPRNGEVVTEYGRVQFGDGFQFWLNPAF